MTERPIIMGAESVRAILEERKTQTRRVIDPRKYNIAGWDMPRTKQDVEAGYPFAENADGDFVSVVNWCPYGRVGDRLYVKERFAYWIGRNAVAYSDMCHKSIEDIEWEDEVNISNIAEGGKWKSPLFMPRWASRITLEITDIRVERVNEITEDDAIAEGVESFESPLYASAEDCENGEAPIEVRTVYRDYSIKEEDNEGYNFFYHAKDSYSTLWDSLNAKRGYPWENNDWVWVITFKVVQS
ncbi:MAG: hypothetical protein EOM48_13340 [Bacilli bacterium]|nr:hypothetical protein [Bacilli bacterium]